MQIKCPNCGNEDNLHLNYDYSTKDLKVIDALCNECGEIFKLEDVHKGTIQFR